MAGLVFLTTADDAGVPRETARILGGARLGAGLPAADWPEQGIAAALPGVAPTALRERWLSPVDCQQGVDEGIAWRRTGDVLYGVIELDEADFAGDARTPLQAASETAYRRIFRLLDAQGLPELWRVWNYLAAINEESHGLERYRQFNLGRQDAFLACHRGATGNVPAACALGLRDGPLSIAFLAGKLPAVAVENPRQVSAYHYPTDYGPRSPTFSRAVLAYPPGQEILFISGTASIVGHRSMHVDDVAAQTRETLTNILAVLGEANRQSQQAGFRPDQLLCRAYLRHADDWPTVAAVIEEMLGPVEVCPVVADVCRADLLVEIEAMAMAAR
ncbi:Rid family hydrolase [Azonexus hydrophilus]|uniref:chorismate transformation enzyme, FkbO/Hyg5 family n=1 Tax=Azonexus hydrophilus TaxID=418702 RepID=UPI002491FD7B|nr:Rid family hydrolase [Azonexus hydrophilus]